MGYDVCYGLYASLGVIRSYDMFIHFQFSNLLVICLILNVNLVVYINKLAYKQYNSMTKIHNVVWSECIHFTKKHTMLYGVSVSISL